MTRYLAVSVVVIVLSGCATLPEHFFDVAGQNLIRREYMLKRIDSERLLFVGEAHTNVKDHLVQLEVIKHLHDGGKKVAIALEVFPSEKQVVLDRWVGGSLNEHDFMEECFRIWDELYRYYGPIFLYAKKNGIPLLGVNTGGSLVNYVAKKGILVIPEDQVRRLKFSSCAEEPAYVMIMGFKREMFTHEMNFAHICDAQRLNDAIIALKIAEYLKKSDRFVVVLLGAAHASKISVPSVVAKHLDISYKVLLPATFRKFIGHDVDFGLADYVWY